MNYFKVRSAFVVFKSVTNRHLVVTLIVKLLPADPVISI